MSLDRKASFLHSITELETRCVARRGATLARERLARSPQPPFGGLIVALTELDRGGYGADARRLRRRIAKALHDLPRYELEQELAIVRAEADGLKQTVRAEARK